MTSLPRVAIIGAGLAGLCLAQGLRDQAEVVVFEKSRGLGGRMSTRRAEDFQFDHGAQYFTAHGGDFQAFLQEHITRGVVATWAPRLVRIAPGARPEPCFWHAPRYVAVPSMNSLSKAIASDLTIVLSAEIQQLQAQDAAWHLIDKAGTSHGPFDWVLSAAPALQTARVMPKKFAGQAQLQATKMDGCYSLMVGFADRVHLGWDAAQVLDAPLQWIADNSTKPGRPGGQSFICQTTNAWAEANIERDQTEVRDTLLDCFRQVTGITTTAPAYLSLHRWRYASVATPAAQPFLLDPDTKLGACGDWCGAGCVEAAYDSAQALMQDIRRHLP